MNFVCLLANAFKGVEKEQGVEAAGMALLRFFLDITVAFYRSDCVGCLDIKVYGVVEPIMENQNLRCNSCQFD